MTCESSIECWYRLDIGFSWHQGWNRTNKRTKIINHSSSPKPPPSSDHQPPKNRVSQDLWIRPRALESWQKHHKCRTGLWSVPTSRHQKLIEAGVAEKNFSSRTEPFWYKASHRRWINFAFKWPGSQFLHCTLYVFVLRSFFNSTF